MANPPAAKPVIAEDDRQKDRDFKRELREVFDVKVKHLRVGDFVWSCPLGLVGVEDKCDADLKASRNNGRLDDELRRLVETFAIPVLFLRKTEPSQFSHWSDSSVENLAFGRQLHGVYVYNAPGEPAGAAEALRSLHTYLSRARGSGMEGVKRERTPYAYRGVLSARAEVVYGILGSVGGVRNRRAIADNIARVTSLSEFLRWTTFDFEAAGFSRLMAKKLATTLATLEAKPSN